MRLKSKTLVLIVLAALLPAARAAAQDDKALLREGLFARDRNVAVTQRTHPEYEPFVQRVGAFSILPSITGTAEANDNIYGYSSNTSSDTIFRINPKFTAQSTWARSQLVLFGGVNSALYASHTGENTTDFNLGADGRLDASRDLGFAGGASYERATEPRTSSSSPSNAIHPVRFDVAKAFGETTYASPRLRLTGRADIEDWSYDNGRDSAGKVVVESDRDHKAYIESGKVEYALLPDTSVFANVVLNQRRYGAPQGTDPRRNSTGYELTVGSNFDLSHVMRGEVFVGYLSQDYDAAAFKGVSGLSVRGRLEWFPTQLTTVTIFGGRGVADAGIRGAGGYATTNVTAQIDHELLRNVLLNGGLSYGKDDYQNYDRKDERTTAQLGVRYLMNRAIVINAGYSHYNQSSSGAKAGGNFDVNRLYASLTYAF